MSKTRICVIAALALTLFLAAGTDLVLHGQESYVPPNKVSKLDDQRSQVFVLGEGYQVDRKQKETHERTEQQRQKQLEQEPTQPQTAPQKVNLSRPVTAVGGGSGRSSAGSRSGSSADKQGKADGSKKPSNKRAEDPTEPERTKKPVIRTDLVNGQEVKGNRLDFWVTATDGYGNNIPVWSEDDGSFTVICNGEETASTGASGKKTYFRLEPLAEGRNDIVITARDRKGQTSELIRWVTGKPEETADKTGQVYVCIQAPILNLGVFFEGWVDIINGDSAKDVLQTAFDQCGIKGNFSGGYLAGISRTGIAQGAWIDDETREIMEDRRQTEKDPAKQNPDKLKEKDFYESSGWLYIVNGDIPQVSLNSYSMEDGDELVLTFQLATDVY